MIYNLQEVPTQLTQVAQWQYQEWGWRYAGQTMHDRLLQVQMHLAGDAIPSTFVAIENDLLAGMVSLVVNDLAEQPALTPWLASLYVDPQYRNKGLGTQLVKHAEQAAYDCGYDLLFLYTDTALEYFAEREWDVVQTILRSTGEVVLMDRDLTCYEPQEAASTD